MKCAGAVIRVVRGSALARVKADVYHAGITGSTHERVTVAAVSPITRTSRDRVPHGGAGWVSCSETDSVHAAVREGRSQRRRPITIPCGPPAIAYSTLPGAARVQRVVMAWLGSDARCSRKTPDWSSPKLRVARRRKAVP